MLTAHISLTNCLETQVTDKIRRSFKDECLHLLIKKDKRIAQHWSIPTSPLKKIVDRPFDQERALQLCSTGWWCSDASADRSAAAWCRCRGCPQRRCTVARLPPPPKLRTVRHVLIWLPVNFRCLFTDYTAQPFQMNFVGIGVWKSFGDNFGALISQLLSDQIFLYVV